jgi:transglutaminase-like putative cysteine protease
MASLRIFITGVLAAAAFAPAACGDEPRGVAFTDPTTSQWRFGVVVRATGGPVTGILATTPVPMDWPEQTVKFVREQKTPHVSRIGYRTLDGGVRQMLVNIPRLAAGEEASAIVTFEVAKRDIVEPEATEVYKVPPRSSRETAKFLQPSPYIESTDPRIKSLAAELAAEKQPGWELPAAMFDWVRANVRYEFAEQIKPAIAALDDGHGDCEELSSLVIALCRASKIPARAVWVPGHCYPEFYLVDDTGRGHWFPCQAAGADRQFGSMVEDRPILQKGDNFRVPEERGPQRYVKQFLSAKDAAAPPDVRFVLERVE